MSNLSSFYHRRRLGRAPSPPTWLWYEQIPFDHLQDSDSDMSGDSISADEDDDDDEHDDDNQVDEGSDVDAHHSPEDNIKSVTRSGNKDRGNNSNNINNREESCESDLSEEEVDTRDDKSNTVRISRKRGTGRTGDDENNSGNNNDIELCSEDDEEYAPTGSGAEAKVKSQSKKDVKGKQRAVEPISFNDSISTIGKPNGVHKKSNSKSKTPESTRTSSRSNKSHSSRRRRREEELSAIPLRPILTIQKSQGFVWNQDLIVPPYIKERCQSPFLSLHNILPFADVSLSFLSFSITTAAVRFLVPSIYNVFTSFNDTTGLLLMKQTLLRLRHHLPHPVHRTIATLIIVTVRTTMTSTWLRYTSSRASMHTLFLNSFHFRPRLAAYKS